MPNNHHDKEDRLEKHCRRLDTHDAECVICGESDPRCLEKHHLAGEQYGDELVTVCRNCHRKLSDDQLDHAPGLQPDTGNKEAVIGHFLHGLCDFLQMIIARLREFAGWLIRQSCSTEAPA